MSNLPPLPPPDSQKCKFFKQDSDPDLDYFLKAKYGDEIKPIPLIYRKIAYQGDLEQIFHKISVKGYRNISKVSASGEHTIEILERIKKTTCIKLIRSIDFDPYFCEKSGLKPLSDVLKKLRRGLKSLTLVIRRTKMKDEVKQFSLFLARSNNIKKMKVEIPKCSGVEANDFEALAKSCKKFISLKSVDIRLGGFKGVAQALPKVRDMLGNSNKLEVACSYVYFPQENQSLMESSLVPTQVQVFRRKNIVFAKHLKSVTLKFATKEKWYELLNENFFEIQKFSKKYFRSSYFDGADVAQNLLFYFQNYPNLANPIHFSLTFDKMRTSMEVLTALAGMLPKLTNLRFVFIELNNFKLTQYEMMILAKGFVDCKQIEHLTFKYLDKAPLPMEDLIQFITILAKFSTFPKFDLFFRKLFYPEWQTAENRKNLDELGNIKYTLTRQSIHIQKLLSIEEDI